MNKETPKEEAQRIKEEGHREEVFIEKLWGGVNGQVKKALKEIYPEDNHYPKDECEEIERDMPEVDDEIKEKNW